jgi:hypothetical protein
MDSLSDPLDAWFRADEAASRAAKRLLRDTDRVIGTEFAGPTQDQIDKAAKLRRRADDLLTVALQQITGESAERK